MMKMVCGGSEMLALPVLSVSAGQCIQSQALSTATQPATGSQRALLSFAQLCSGSIGTKLSACYMCYSSSLLSQSQLLNSAVVNLCMATSQSLAFKQPAAGPEKYSSG